MNFSSILVQWYHQNKRDLPWRHTSDPYEIWVSEVILQQTRVNQGISYYVNFLRSFPTVFDLANSDIDAVLKVWQGLGYYTRARNMHKTAKEVVEKMNGIFPSSYKELILLKGIGDYTASAVAAFAFNEAVPAIDGNVYRIFSRIFGVETPIDTAKGKNELRQIAFDMLDKSQPATYNQAIMDFGGTLCTPKKPLCQECPVMEICSAFRNRTVEQLPVKSKKIKKSIRFFTYIIPVENGYTFIAKRIKSDIWNSLYEFPLIELSQETSVEELVKTTEWAELFGNHAVDIEYTSEIRKYVLSHQHIFARFLIVRIQNISAVLNNNFSKVTLDEIHSYSTPRLIEGFLAAEPVEKYFKRES